MGLYLGNKKVKFNLNGKYYKLNILVCKINVKKELHFIQFFEDYSYETII